MSSPHYSEDFYDEEEDVSHVYLSTSQQPQPQPPQQSVVACTQTSNCGSDLTSRNSDRPANNYSSANNNNNIVYSTNNRGSHQRGNSSSNAPLYDDITDQYNRDRSGSGPYCYNDRGHLVRCEDSANTQAEQDAEFDRIEREARIALEAIAVHEEDVEENAAAYLATLRAYREACKQRAMYREANLVQQVLRSLRIEEESRHVRGLTQTQMGERLMLEDSHRDEFRNFHRLWNAKIDDFEEQQLELEIALLERQNDELIAFQEEMRDYNPRIQRYSRRLIHSRTRQQNLAKQKEFTLAEVEKQKADQIEVEDMEKFEGTRSGMYERREYALRHRHQQELHALRMKVESKRLFLERHRKRELDELLQRYLNSRRELETQQNVVRSKTGTLLLKHALNNKSDMSGTSALAASAASGTFGTVVQRRHRAEMDASNNSHREEGQHQHAIEDGHEDYDEEYIDSYNATE